MNLSFRGQTNSTLHFTEDSPRKLEFFKRSGRAAIAGEAIAGIGIVSGTNDAEEFNVTFAVSRKIDSLEF